VALNCVANGRVIRETPMKDLFVQPAAGDAGGAVGVAHYIYNTLHKRPRTRGLDARLPGPRVQGRRIKSYLDSRGVPYQALPRAELLRTDRRAPLQGNVIGCSRGAWSSGRRALGGRSILADPREREDARHADMKIKFREGFRPSRRRARGKASEWFDIDCDSPYMLLVAQVREGKRPSRPVTTSTTSARLQTVTRDESPLYYDLIAEFEKITGCPS